MALSDLRLTREGVCRTFKLSPETLEQLEATGVLQPDADHLFDVGGVAASLFHFGMSRAAEADRKLAAVGKSLHDVLPALQQLAGLADRLNLEGEVRERVMGELSTFFNAFAALLGEATDVLREGE